MRPSRRVARRVVAFAAVVLVAALALGAPAGVADAALAETQSLALELEAPASVQMARIDVVELQLQTTPESIETGISCGMNEMCGLDPCLCGAVDAWGACACNGTETTRPSLALSCEQGGVVGTFQLFGKTYLVALGTGSTDVEVTASLVHYDDAQATVHVEVAPFGALDALKLVVALVAAAGVCAAVFFGVRALVRLVARAARRSRSRGRGGGSGGRAGGAQGADARSFGGKGGAPSGENHPDIQSKDARSDDL